METIHNRMPVILRKEDYAFWLSPQEESAPALQTLLKPFDPDAMTAYPVSKMVNRPNNDTPELIKPVAYD
jgi:putative SOS response-associated peptidase YedK